MDLKCWKCGIKLSAQERKTSFRAVCEACGSDLHCCKNCRNYTLGKPNDCAIPGTDYVKDRTANNFCEEFNILGERLSDGLKSEKKRFDDLFKL